MLLNKAALTLSGKFDNELLRVYKYIDPMGLQKISKNSNKVINKQKINNINFKQVFLKQLKKIIYSI